MRIEYEYALEFFLWGLEAFSRRDCGLILAGYRQTSNEREVDRLLERLRAQRLIEREGRGRTARFRITANGQKRLRVDDPYTAWDRGWDGKWRVFSFDLPANRQKDRMLLYRALRANKLGLLQRSVWVWPQEVEPLLRTIVETNGIPECFCGFEAGRLFLCNTAEVVATAWDFEEINRHHDHYLKHMVVTPKAAHRASDLRELARLARLEREAYNHAFFLDPLLPRALWPKL